MKKEIIGIIGQYACLTAVIVGGLYEHIAGAHWGFVLITLGGAFCALFTKIRGK